MYHGLCLSFQAHHMYDDVVDMQSNSTLNIVQVYNFLSFYPYNELTFNRHTTDLISQVYQFILILLSHIIHTILLIFRSMCLYLGLEVVGLD